MKGKIALAKKITPVYAEFFRLLHRNAMLELEVKEAAVGQIKAKDDEKKIQQLSQKKAGLLDEMVRNNFKMDRLKLKLRALDRNTPFKKSSMFSKLDEVGAKSGTNALNIGRDNIKALQKLSKMIEKAGFGKSLSGVIRGPIDPCMCQGCSGCSGCTTLCEATCGHCIGCTGCTGCSGCGDTCSSCFGVSWSQPKKQIGTSG